MPAGGCGRRPGKRGLVPPFPPILERLVRTLVDEKRLLPSAARPDSVIINHYGAGDCIPPHVDHAAYYRPISTLSLLGEVRPPPLRRRSRAARTAESHTPRCPHC